MNEMAALQQARQSACEIGPLMVSYTKKGDARFEVTIVHRGLRKHQTVKGTDSDVVRMKVGLIAEAWEDRWETVRKKAQEAEMRQKERKDLADAKREKAQEADQRTQEARQILANLQGTLAHTLTVNDKIDWDTLKNKKGFPIEEPAEPEIPTEPLPPSLADKPRRNDPRYIPRLTFIDSLFAARKAKRAKEAEDRFLADHAAWETKARAAHESFRAQVEEYKRTVAVRRRDHESEVRQWTEKRSEYEKERTRLNNAIDTKKEAYLSGNPAGIFDYCEMVLSNSKYPDFFPKAFDIEYNSNNRILIVDYALPVLDALPTLSEVKYVPSRDEFTERHLSEVQIRALYDSLLYQLALRTIHELFEADAIDALSAIVFNGMVTAVDPATGNEATSCILSIQASKEEFLPINLANVDPKACFKKLKGVGSSKLHTLTPVAPLLDMEREDRRFTESYKVVDGVDNATNLAAMDWEDFEHLIRELFEHEFAAAGGEVRVTRASRDGGVDAVIFDPDPLRGGKIVIQAKRYTNTVGVSAVRDLYGTLLNEGANKGILVSTADFGPDAYEFAKGKPITLLNGNNLLFLLEKHGHKAKIDLKEAKRILTERNELSTNRARHEEKA